MAYLLDTNALIYLFKNQGNVRQRVALRQDHEICMCTPVLWELKTGALKSSQPEAALQKLAFVQSRFKLLTFDEACADQAARVRASLELQGTPIGPIDTLIAGTALAHELTLVTRNLREFQRVPGLAVEDWYS